MGARIERGDFDAGAVDRWSRQDRRHMNWPVVYVVDNQAVAAGGQVTVYLGE